MDEERIRQIVEGKIEQIEHSNSGNLTLAKLRKGIGKAPGEIPELWSIVVEDLPEGISEEEQTAAEWSVYIALVLYVHHRLQQKNVHRHGGSLGSAVKLLVIKKDDPDGEKRFVSEMMRITSLTEPNMIFSRLNHLIKHLAQTKSFSGLCKTGFRYISDSELRRRSSSHGLGNGFLRLSV